MSDQDTTKRVITGPAGFALMRLAKRSGVYEFYRELAKKAKSGAKKDTEAAKKDTEAAKKDAEAIGLEMMFGISERLADCEQEFWEAAAAIYGKNADEVKGMPFDEVRSTVVGELMDPGMIAFFSKTQAASGK